MSCSVAEPVLWPPNNKFSSIALKVSAVDDSGVAPRVNVRVFSNEPDPQHENASPAHSFSSSQLPVSVRRQRLSTGDGRVYLFHVRATDASGNLGFGVCSAVVPRDRSQVSIGAVLAEAAGAAAHATAAGSPRTPYRVGSLHNSAPSASADMYSTDEDRELVVPAPGVLANDSDAEGEPLAVALVTATAHGSLDLQPNGAFRYLPDPNYFGTDSFTYRVTAGALGSNARHLHRRGAVTVNIQVRAEQPDQPVSASTDDADETDSGVVRLTTFTAKVGKGYTHAFRFIGLPIPQGATITSASLKLVAAWGIDEGAPVDNTTPVSFRYAAEATAHSAPITIATGNISSRPRTAHFVDDTPAPWVDRTYNTGPDISSVVQEVVDRPDWAPGGAMTIFLLDNGSASIRKIWTYDAGTDFVPQLTVKYVGGIPPAPPVAGDWAVRFADAILAYWPDPTKIWPGWTYDAGIVFHGMRKIYEQIPDPRYFTYIKTWVDAFVSDSGALTWNTTVYNLDFIQPALLLTFLHDRTGAEKYRIAAQTVRERFNTWPRNGEGGFTHNSRRRPNEMLIDGIYMAQPFLARYGRLFGDTEWCNNTVFEQTSLVTSHTFDPAASLLYHGWDWDKDATWADPVTGVSPEFWIRGTGWYAMALVDILDDYPVDDHRYAWFQEQLRLVIDGLARTQDPLTGLWYQAVDKGQLRDNWRETSGSGMAVYAIKKAVVRGHVDPSYLAVAEKGWAGVQSRILVDPSGLPVIIGAVLGMGPQNDYASYINKTRLNNSTHALVAIQLAAVAMEHY